MSELSRRDWLEIGWAPAAVFVAHWLYGNLVAHTVTLDLVMHSLGGMAIAHAAWVAVPKLRRHLGAVPPATRALLALGAAFVVACLWEYAEFFADMVWDLTIQSSVEETMVDLMLGTGAAVVYVALMSYRARSTVSES